MTKIPGDVLIAAREQYAAMSTIAPYAIEQAIARAILAERERCIRSIVDAANAGRYTPLSELVTAIRGEG